MPARKLMIIRYLKIIFPTRCSFIVHLMNENEQGEVVSGRWSVVGYIYINLIPTTYHLLLITYCLKKILIRFAPD